MKSYLKIHSKNSPTPIEITPAQVFINKNIVPYETEEFSGFEYDVDIYDKDEYITLLAQNQQDIANLREELEAAKIILGVE